MKKRIRKIGIAARLTAVVAVILADRKSVV